MKKKLLVLTVGLVVPFLFACTDEEVTKPVESISLNKTETTLNIGSSEVLKATATPLEASQEFVWKSSANNAVTVIGGKITAYALPEVVYKESEKANYYDADKDAYFVEISASNYTKDKKALKTAVCKVFVTNIPKDESVKAESISLSDSTVNLLNKSGVSKELYATVSPFETLTDAAKEVEWSVEQITDNEEDGNNVIGLSIIYQPDSSVSDTDPDYFRKRNSSKVIITPQHDGTAIITAKSKKIAEDDQQFSATCAITVKTEDIGKKVESIEFAEDLIEIEQGQTGQNSLSITPWYAENNVVEYTSSDTSIATVDPNTGLVTVKADAPVDEEVTITATTKPSEHFQDEEDQKTDSYIVKVAEHHVNFITIKRAGTNNFVNKEMALKEPGSTEYTLSNFSLKMGDTFCFCTNGAWHHYEQLKTEGEGSAHADFTFEGEDLVAERSGVYEIFVDSATAETKSIFIKNKSYDPVVVTMDVYRNGELHSSDTLSLKDGSTTEYESTKALEAGDEVVFDVSGLEMGYAQLKDGHVAPIEKPLGSNRIKVQHSLTYNFFIETGNVEGGKKRIWVNGNYMMLCHPEQEWTYTNVGINPEPGKNTEYKVDSIELSAGDKLVFNVGNGWYHYGNIKADCDFKQYFDSDDYGNFIANHEGTYDFYIETKDGPEKENPETHEIEVIQSIWIVYHSDSDDAKLLVNGGSPIALEAKSTHEFAAYNIEIEKDTEFIAYINGTKFGFNDLKVGGASGNYGQGSLESEGIYYLSAKGTLTVSIFVDLNGDDDGNNIWISTNFMLVEDYLTTQKTYVNIGINPEVGKETEFKASDVELDVGDKVTFCLNNEWYHYSEIKTTNPYVYSHFEDDGHGNLQVKIANTYTFYIETNNGPQEHNSIWITAPISNITYTFQAKGDESFDYLTAGAKFYMWAFEYEGQEGGRWLEGTNTGTSLTFSIPSNYRYAQVVRLSSTSVISDVEHWSGVDTTEKWNRTEDGNNVWLSGVNSNIHFYLINW